MKIRIKGNSIRYRLTKTEVESFCAKGKIRETTDFGTATLTYALEVRDNIKELGADFKENIITVYFPSDFALDWATSNQIGYGNSVDWNNEKKLSLLVEKDFTCLDNTVEDQSDNYPNPKLQAKN